MAIGKVFDLNHELATLLGASFAARMRRLSAGGGSNSATAEGALSTVEKPS